MKYIRLNVSPCISVGQGVFIGTFGIGFTELFAKIVGVVPKLKYKQNIGYNMRFNDLHFNTWVKDLYTLPSFR